MKFVTLFGFYVVATAIRPGSITWFDIGVIVCVAVIDLVKLLGDE